MPVNKHLSQAQSELRKYALTFPASHEDFPWGEVAIKVNGKIFVCMSLHDGALNVTVKLPLSSTMAVGLPFAAPTGYGLGKSGWVTARFSGKDEVPIEMIEEWIAESFRAVAPKRVVAQLDEGAGVAARKPDPAARPGRKRRAKA